MLKNLLNYFKYSGLWVGIVLNPYHWEFKFDTKGERLLETYLLFCQVNFGPVWIRGIIDDGSW